MNDLMIFEGNQVEIILNEKEEPLFEIYSTGMALGYIKQNTINGKTYYQCRKDRVDKTIESAEIKPLVQDGLKYLTEEQLYDFMLEAHTDKCKKFKKWITHEVLPKLRKTGTYSTKDKYISEIDIAKAELSLVEVTAKLLNLNDSSKLALATNVYENHNIPTNLLPQYTKSKDRILPVSDLLKKNYINMSAISFNKLLVEKGILKECTRKTSSGRNKKFKMLVDTEWGENLVNPKCPKETQPMYYQDKFCELLKIVL